MTPAHERAAARFWAKVEKGPGCWLWTAARTSRGYGCFGFGGKGRNILAHRFAYELCVGPIPEGLTIDHVRARGCASKLCVNPAHLEPVPGRENSQRYARAITHCKAGHPLAGNNLTVRPNGRRRCIACNRIASKAQWERPYKPLRIPSDAFDKGQLPLFAGARP